METEVFLGERRIAAVVRLTGGLCLRTTAEIFPAEPVKPRRKQPLKIVLRDGDDVIRTFPLVVRRYDIDETTGQGTMQATDDVVATARRFDWEVFGGDRGVTPKDVLSTRLEAADPDRLLEQSLGAVVAIGDRNFQTVLNDLCARIGAHWSIDETGLVIRKPEQPKAQDIRAHRVRRRVGCRLVLTDAWRAPGSAVKADGFEGIVRGFKLHDTLNDPVELWLELGSPRRLKLSPPRAEWNVDGTIHSLDPFRVALAGGRGATEIVDALLMVRQSGAGFLEELPLAVDGRVKVEFRRGGVSVGPPDAYPVSPGSVSKKGYRLVALAREDVLDDWKVEVNKNAKVDVKSAEVRTERIEINELK